MHPADDLAKKATLAAAMLPCPFAFADPYASIGESVFLNTRVSVWHDAAVGGGSTLSPYSCPIGSSDTGRVCFLDCAVILSPESSAGGCSRLSAGSIVNGGAESDSLVQGSPARGLVMRRVNL